MMTVKIKFCPHNFKGELNDLINYLKQLENVIVADDLCLNYCGQCLVHPFALINGKNITGKSVAELQQKVVEYLDGIKNS
ncbi:DUF1450 domain-containing protein [Anaerobacillus sp. CMMVII]|uniref:YuzB family protein n=1 Tax=Anaerobacillus sp. CMMVII TaxID=2755588 RepID=UPI0021B7086A|nr:YuzB family protein [Anaerobacillus sp. CMMVII]MCT8139210.1 DUF1450 domain-containing protein [Anaerobacillus sp. CMMVII]